MKTKETEINDRNHNRPDDDSRCGILDSGSIHAVRHLQEGKKMVSALAGRDKNLKMRKDIEDAINEADIYWKCSGMQTEYISELELEEWNLEDADAVVNNILGIVSDYIVEVL